MSDYYYIINKKNGAVISVPDVRDTPLMAMQQYNKDADFQLWSLGPPAKEGYIVITNKKTGDVMDAKEATGGAPAYVDREEAAGTDSQLWTRVPSGTDGYYLIMSLNSKWVLDVDSTQLVITSKQTGVDSQLWQIVLWS